MKAAWVIFGIVAFLGLQASASECGLGGWNILPSGFSSGCPGPKTTCCTSYPPQCGCGLPKTTCCTSYPPLSLPSCGYPRPCSSCCSGIPSCGSGLPLELSSNGLPYGLFPNSLQSCGLPSCGLPSCGLQPCGLPSCGLPPCGCPVPKTTTCTTIPFGNPICGKTTTCTTYPNPCGKSTTTCTTVPHANPACAKTTTCHTLPLDPCSFSCCNPCGSLYGKTCCTSFQLPPGKCGNPLCKCGYCTCPSPCNCGYF